ncbi:hypothetical protein BC830DRAFT_458730 [Chytriomyces sp. MP71]|nr:hypothetical protein BC830DRAFT_458730 [Chytriomyces sp. MP71]
MVTNFSVGERERQKGVERQSRERSTPLLNLLRRLIQFSPYDRPDHVSERVVDVHKLESPTFGSDGPGFVVKCQNACKGHRAGSRDKQELTEGYRMNLTGRAGWETLVGGRARRSGGRLLASRQLRKTRLRYIATGVCAFRRARFHEGEIAKVRRLVLVVFLFFFFLGFPNTFPYFAQMNTCFLCVVFGH